MIVSLLGLFLGLGALTVAANLIEKRGSRLDRRRFMQGLLAINLPLPPAGILLLVQPDLLAPADAAAAAAVTSTAWSLIFMGGLGVLAVLPPVRRSVSRLLPIDADSAVHMLALLLAAYLVGQAVGNQVSGGLQLLESAGGSAGIVDVVANQLLFLLLGLLGAGWLTRRRGAQLAERLGLRPPTWAEIRYGMLWIVPLVIFQGLVGALWATLAPEQAALLENVNATLLAEFDTVGEWFILAISPGIAEEILFRGALQPVFGLWASSLLFALAHNQYALTPGTAIVFVIGLALGHIRREKGTSVAILVHFGYNFLLGLLSLLAAQVGAVP